MRVPDMGLTASSFRFSQPILASAEPAPPVARRLRRLRRLRLLTTGQDDRRYTGQVHCRRPAMWHKTMGVQAVQQLTSELRVGRVTRSASKNVSALSRCSDGA